jgi:hypothetical protein
MNVKAMRPCCSHDLTLAGFLEQGLPHGLGIAQSSLGFSAALQDRSGPGNAPAALLVIFLQP